METTKQYTIRVPLALVERILRQCSSEDRKPHYVILKAIERGLKFDDEIECIQNPIIVVKRPVPMDVLRRIAAGDVGAIEKVEEVVYEKDEYSQA